MSRDDPISMLIGLLTRLPGIGRKSATRLCFHLLSAPKEYKEALAQALLSVSERIRLCSSCCSYTEADPCAVCTDPRRDPSVLCVVSRVQDMMALESAGIFHGLYHVLHGVLNPLEGIGPNELKIPQLLARLATGTVQEVILAQSPSVEGETTSIYLVSLLEPFNVKVSRIASGVPMGGELEYTDTVTLDRALQDRREVSPPKRSEIPAKTC